MILDNSTDHNTNSLGTHLYAVNLAGSCFRRSLLEASIGKMNRHLPINWVKLLNRISTVNSSTIGEAFYSGQSCGDQFKRLVHIHHTGQLPYTLLRFYYSIRVGI
jgi:hypothetical protein